MIFPSWQYGPGDQSAVFERIEDVPAGWHPHPSMVADALPVALDHDGDGKPGGSINPEPSQTLNELRAEYLASFGKRPFNGWSVDTLLQKLSDRHF